jgi:cytochrome P450
VTHIPSAADFSSGVARNARWSGDKQVFQRIGKPGLKELKHLPGRRGLPLVGILPEAVLNPYRFAQRMHARHGRAYRFYASGSWNVQLVGPEANELVLFDRDSTYSAWGGWSPVIEPFFPGALLIQDGEEHRANRRILGEAFRQQKLTGYQAIFDQDIGETIRFWRGRQFDVYEEVKRLTFRIAASTFLGVRVGSESDKAISAFGDMMGALLALSPNPRLSRRASRGYAARTQLEFLITRLVAEKRREPGDDILSRICTLRDDDGEPLAVRDICNSIIFLLTAAHDTLASAFTSVMYFLAQDSRWANDLRSELLGSNLERAVDAPTAELPLQDMVLKEALRLNAAAPVIWRRSTQPVSIYGYDIPAGTITGVAPLLVHLDPEIWHAPLAFNPLRFEPSEEAKRHKHAFVPFGGGVHKCLGMHFAQQQARIFMTHLVSELDLSLVGRDQVSWYHWPNCRPRSKLLVSAAARSPHT